MDITIRTARAEDALDLHDILTSPHVVKGTMRLPFMALESTKARLAPDPNRLQIVAESAGRVVGFAELLTNFDVPRASHAAELNMVVVDQDVRRSGIARQLITSLLEMCDHHFGIHRIALTVWADNGSAIPLYEDLGFAVEGRMRDYVRADGSFKDAILMARFREKVV